MSIPFKNLPDKWIRKAFYDLINNMVVNSTSIPVFDSRVTTSQIPDFYVVLSTQTSEVLKASSCEYSWNSGIDIEVITAYQSTLNPGSRVFSEDIVDEIITLTQNLELDVASNLSITTKSLAVSDNLVVIDETQNAFRKTMAYTFRID